MSDETKSDQIAWGGTAIEIDGESANYVRFPCSEVAAEIVESGEIVGRVEGKAAVALREIMERMVGAESAWNRRSDDAARQRGVAEGIERAAAKAHAWSRADEIRLHAGELSAQEMRTTQAVIKALAHSIRALPDAPTDPWRPIESAPRDGTVFLGYHQKYGWQGVCRFDMPDDDCPEAGNEQWVFMRPVHVTHWQPLLAPPTGDDHD